MVNTKFCCCSSHYHQTVLLRVRSSVTNNNWFWIGWLDLLTPSFTISLNHNQLEQLTINLLPRTRSILILLFRFSHKFWTELRNSLERSHMTSLYNLGKDQIELTTTNSSSIIVYLFVAAETCLASRCLAMDVLWLHTSCIQAYLQFAKRDSFYCNTVVCPCSVNFAQRISVQN
jgi:hypothetical protein